MYIGKTKILKENNLIHLAVNFSGLCIKVCDKSVHDIEEMETSHTNEVTCKECIKCLEKADETGKAVL